MPANDSGARIAQNILTSYLPIITGIATGFLLTPILIRYLGATQFGLYTYLLTLINYVGLVELGIQTAVVKRVAECLALNDIPRMNRVVSASLALYLIASIIVLAITGVLIASVGLMPNLAPGDRPAARMCLLALGINQAISFVFATLPAALYGAGRLDLTTLLNTFFNLAISVGNVFLVAHGCGIAALGYTALTASLFNGLLVYRIVRRHLPGVSPNPRHATRKMAHELIRFGSRNALLSIAGSIGFASDTIVIGLLLPLASVAYYVVASKLSGLIVAFVSRPIDALMPAYSHSYAQNDTSRQFYLFTTSISVASVLCLPFVIAVAVFGAKIIAAWVGPGYEASHTICFVLLLTSLIQLPGRAAGQFLRGTEQNVFYTRLYLVAAPLNLALSGFLTLRLGPVGVALGSLAMVFVVDFWILSIHACRLMGFEFRAYLLKILTPLIAPLCVAIAAALTLNHLPLPTFRITPFLMLVLTVIAGWGAWLLFSIGASERAIYFKTLRRIIKK